MSFGLVISGGYDGAQERQEIYHTKDGNQFHRFPTDLPGITYKLYYLKWTLIQRLPPFADKRYGHCQIAIDEDTFMILGGHGYVDGQISWLSSCYMFNRVTGWEPLPDMLDARSHVACGLVRHPDGRKEVIVGGGHG